MGNVEKFVKARETEKHKTTEEFIDTLLWYCKSMNKIMNDFVSSTRDINEAFNSRMAEIKTEAAKK